MGKPCTSRNLKCDGHASGWQDTPQFKALSQSDQSLFTAYLDYTANGQLRSTRDSSCNTVVTSPSFLDSAIQPAMLSVIRAASNQAINQVSRYITSDSYKNPDLSKLSNKDVKNAQCCLLQIIGAMCSIYQQVQSNQDVKTIIMNTMDGFCTGLTALMILVDATDPTVAAHSDVGDLVYRDRRIGVNTVGFGITASGVNKALDLVCTLAHGYGHWQRFPFHTSNPTADNSSNHYVDEIISYYTEFTVRCCSSIRPSGNDMEVATKALGNPNGPYTYSTATGDDAAKIQVVSDKVRMKEGDNTQKAPDPSQWQPDGASWNYLNNS